MRIRFKLIVAVVIITLLGVLEVAHAQQNPIAINTSLSNAAIFSNSFELEKLLTDSTYAAAVKTGEITDTVLRETSGIAASRAYSKLWWTHNDSGNPNDIYLIDEQGNKRAVVTLKGCTNRDWEEITIGPGPVKGKNYLYVSETGDNHFKYGEYCIYRLQEPVLDLKKGEVVHKTLEAEKINIVYPDGPRNAEALLLDPLTRDLYIVTKNKLKAEAEVYVAPYPQALNHTITLTKLGVLPILKVTSGAISPDGSEIVIKNLEKIFYWKRVKGESVANVLKTTPKLLQYVPEPQGEAINWTPDGKALYTLSEKKGPANQAIYQYKRK